VTDALSALLGTALGGVIGGGWAYLSAARQWRREQAIRWDATRREVYGSFLGRCNACHGSLCAVAWAIHPKRRLSQTEIDARWSEANDLYSEMTSAKGEVDLLATGPTQKAADAIQNRLDELKLDLYRHDRDRTAPGSEREYEPVYRKATNEFLLAARAELKLGHSVERGTSSLHLTS
jgi:hypothetical protein